jgi:hypothetical protein
VQVVIISLVSILLFQGVLVVLSAISTVFVELNSGFLTWIDVASKAATVAVFLWAVHTFISQKKDKEKEQKYTRLKDLSYRLIDYVGRPDFTVTKNSASILIAYLEAIITEASQGDVATEHLKEKKLALDVTYETLKRTSLNEALGLDGSQDYFEIIEMLKALYSSSDKLANFDSEMMSCIEQRRRRSINMKINMPSNSLQQWQILKILSLVLEQEEDELEEELISKPKGIDSRHYQLPVLYAIYYVYSNGTLHIASDDNFTFTTSGMPIACEYENCL